MKIIDKHTIYNISLPLSRRCPCLTGNNTLNRRCPTVVRVSRTTILSPMTVFSTPQTTKQTIFNRMHSSPYHLLIILLLCSLTVQGQKNSLPVADTCNELYMWVFSPNNRLDGEQIYQPDLAVTFYTDRNCQAAWYSPQLQFSRIDSLMEILHDVSINQNTHYLYLERNLDEIQSFYIPLGLFDYQQLYTIDVFLTDAALNYALQIVSERYGDEVMPSSVGILLANQLEDALKKNTLRSFFYNLSAQEVPAAPANEVQKAEDAIERATKINPTDTLPQPPLIIKDPTVYHAVIAAQNAVEPVQLAGERVMFPDACNDFYRQRQFTVAWLPHNSDNPLIKTLLAALKNAPKEGLQTSDYHTTAIEQQLQQANAPLLVTTGVSPLTAAELDLLLTDAALLYARHLALGKLNPRKLGFTWDVYQNKFDWADELQKALNANNLTALYDKMLPKHIQYTQLKNKLAKYQAIQPDSLSNTDKKHIEQLQKTMETWRWLPNNLGRRYILVNIPSYTLFLYENNSQKPSQTKRVVVGEIKHKTPTFSDQMQSIELNPYWTVPPSIAKKEILPALKRSGANYLKRNKMEVFSGGEKINASAVKWSNYSVNNFPFTIRQKPNGKNALGEVKFLFPNPYNVYIHDTPSRHLFMQTPRAFSHGCIRLHEPLDFAAYLLKDLGYTRSKIDNIIAGNNNQPIVLPNPIPVYIVYLTAWADGENVRFYEDVYFRNFKLN